MKKYCIIVAGGSGRRMKSATPKQFLTLAGKPVLMHTMERFSSFDPDISIILVLPAEHHALWRRLCIEHSFEVPHLVVTGGEERFHSVKAGLARVAADMKRFAGVKGAAGTPESDRAEGAAGIVRSESTSGAAGTPGSDGTEGGDGTVESDGTGGTAGSLGSDGAEGTAGIPESDRTEGAAGTPGSDGTGGGDGTVESDRTKGAAGTPGSDGTEGVHGIAGIPDVLIAIHDGVRPLVSHDTIWRCYSDAEEFGNAVPFIEPADSVRVLSDDDSTPVPRNQVRLIQTPQVFRGSVIIKAYERMYDPSFTDDATVAEADGVKIHLTHGNRENLKITTPADLAVATTLAGLPGQ